MMWHRPQPPAIGVLPIPAFFLGVVQSILDLSYLRKSQEAGMWWLSVTHDIRCTVPPRAVILFVYGNVVSVFVVASCSRRSSTHSKRQEKKTRSSAAIMAEFRLRSLLSFGCESETDLFL